MSLLERALRRARSENGVDPVLTAPDASRVSSAVFVSPWQFDETESGSEPPRTGAALSADAPPVPEPDVAAAPAQLPAPSQPSVARPPAAAAGVPRPATAIAPGSKPAPSPLPQFTGFRPEVRSKLVVGDQASPTLREQFRNVASSLYRMRLERPVKIVMVVSAAPGEGKTLTSTNLALTLSESYHTRVLLIDADLRRPSLHSLFDVPNQIGLKDDLAAPSETRPSAIRVTQHLNVLLAGSAPLDPMSALTSDRMRAILGRAAVEFEWVVIDTPPVELMSDAKILAAAADAAVLVVEAGRTPCESARKAVEAVGRERVIGVVLNQLTDSRAFSPYGYSGYQSYSTETQ